VAAIHPRPCCAPRLDDQATSSWTTVMNQHQTRPGPHIHISGLAQQRSQLPPAARVSVIVPVKNEAHNLRRCLPSLAWADEVFVVDSQSTDETAQVVADHGARLEQFHFNGTYPKKKNWALENLPFRNEWILIVDADEVVVPELAEEIARRTAADEADGFYLNMKYYFLGRRIRHCGYAEAWNLRLFKHRLGRYERMPVSPQTQTGDNEAHEHVELQGRAKRLVHELDHFAYPSISVWVEKHNRYATWEAEMFERFLREPVPSSIGTGKRLKRLLKKVYLRLPMRPLVRFLYSYIIRFGFLDGMPGLVFCGLLSFYDFLCWAKVYERRLGESATSEMTDPLDPRIGIAAVTNPPGKTSAHPGAVHPRAKR
jgi:glycosyltransferase involved in cell wall biosynthesis